MNHRPHPSEMTPEERFREVADILARATARLLKPRREGLVPRRDWTDPPPENPAPDPMGPHPVCSPEERPGLISPPERSSNQSVYRVERQRVRASASQPSNLTPQT